MEKYYEGENILEQISARFVPLDDAHPDCICSIILGVKSIYVLEDMFDGSFNCIFKIPLHTVLIIEQYISDETNSLSLSIKRSDRRQLSENANNIYLRIIYKNENDELGYLFFNECSNINGMVSKFNKLIIVNE